MPRVDTLPRAAREPLPVKRVLKYLAFFSAVLFLVYSALNMSGYKLALNKSESMATAIYGVTPLNSNIVRGEYAYFHIPPNPYFAGDLVKRVVGIAGDEIRVEGSDVFVNGVLVGPAKPLTRKGLPLTKVEGGVVPNGFVFVAGDHIDSYDSRYQEFGFVSVTALQGRARELF